MERAVKLAIAREKFVAEDSYAGRFRSMAGSEELRMASRLSASSISLGEREREEAIA